jgi:hypothetical protein
MNMLFQKHAFSKIGFVRPMFSYPAPRKLEEIVKLELFENEVKE